MISKIRLTNLRNFRNKIFEFSPKITVIVGPNASGKTNILESLFLLSTGKSFRAKIEEEMVNYDKDLARVKGKLSGENKNILEVVLTRGLIDIGTDRPEKVARKKLLVNGIGKRLIDFAGNFKIALFGPWDLGLVTESPSTRRKFLDYVLSQVDREYRRAILSYEKGLRQRNRVLWQIREDPSTSSGPIRLLFWNKLLIKNGDYMNQRRREFIEFTNAGNFHFPSSIFHLEYDPSVISEGRLEQYADEEIAAAITLVGPHRDDFIFKSNTGNKSSTGRELARYGSRGEQRMGVFWLKLAELSFIEEKSGEKPTLLLDDIFSELDDEHREIVMKTALGQQTIITTADPHSVKNFGKIEKIVLK